MSQELEKVRLEAGSLLMRYIDPAHVADRVNMVMSLQPKPEDYARVFIEEAAPYVRAVYENVWKTPPLWRVRAEQNFLRVSAATVEEMQTGTGQAPLFPGGYRDVVPYLQKDFIWVCWEYLEAGHLGGMSFDGLVPIEGRWAWFPKPWKALPKKPKRDVSHWSE